ncbi:LPXTG cell wall anchor domain-containing protein [Enterococcus casseliflavus]|uniref:LPXTG cell wall anchor domain-containing protein n=1 Tax=Enterococcus sp. 8E11_MSG4843 TaxID=1834190 RepID=UPI000B3E4B02|nr:LPXTG cell wall anchor domain-containing protein [Enterococcus sp. 8E11_MSG4843]MBO1097908.1 LPXTG cell wall anchor domain-containing protein [Enterococcus casseliflavus]MBO1142569.1 LPXTG cell wall anchor domain-containing protein [Enterococcus casseliflavus]OUZ30149.1 hypothetical protein A5885_003330 [Enterococcus sp. 8E11_MSG4843]
MGRKKTNWFLLALLFVTFPFNLVSAREVQQVETHGTIGFTGVYEPIGTPDPIPPESIIRPPITEVAKPGGNLPQTDERDQSWLIWIGVLIISVAFLLWKRNRENKLKN